MLISSAGKPVTKFLLHLHPSRVEAGAISFKRTFGLGGIAALLLTVLFVTGLMLRFVYVPSAAGAYDSIVAMQQQLVFGSLLRNLHHWSAMLLVLVSFLHLARVFYAQAIFNKRRKNWIYGLLLFFLVISANFTGYLLPWDQLSYWAVTIMTNMLTYIPLIGDGLAGLIRVGEIVNENTLLRFYHFHTGLLPVLLVLLLAIHFWLVRKAGGVAIPHNRTTQKLAVYPNLVYKELAVALMVLFVLMLFSALVDAPLLDQAKPDVTPNPAKAPWYFLGFQELLIHVHPFMGAFIIPLAVMVFFVSIPFFNFQNLEEGQWFYSVKGRKMAIASALFAFALTFVSILLGDLVFGNMELIHSWPPALTSGVLPLLTYVLPVFFFLLYFRKRHQAESIELVIALVTIILTAYLTMMLTAILLRGEGMKLIFL
jgi:quinol-cytochrome oxidoreductase complex cytochrome b subunit